MNWKYILSGDINLVDSSNLATLLCKQFERSVFVEVFDLLMPFVSIQTSTHQLSLLGMEQRITTKHEV